MNANFGDKRIALEPIPKDATAVVVRVETWEKMESDLATLRAELDAKTAEAMRLKAWLKRFLDWCPPMAFERDMLIRDPQTDRDYGSLSHYWLMEGKALLGEIWP